MEEEFEWEGTQTVYVDEQVGNTITIPITGYIEAPDKYNDVAYYLRSAQPQDSVELLINSEGGRVDGALHIVAAMQACQAHEVKATITGDCASAATFIFFAASSWAVPDFATMLLHSTTYGAGGITNHILQMAEHEKKHLKRVCEIFYAGFLTQQEIKDLMRGDQLYFLADEIGVRLDKRIKHMQKEAEKDNG